MVRLEDPFYAPENGDRTDEGAQSLGSFRRFSPPEGSGYESGRESEGSGDYQPASCALACQTGEEYFAFIVPDLEEVRHGQAGKLSHSLQRPLGGAFHRGYGGEPDEVHRIPGKLIPFELPSPDSQGRRSTLKAGERRMIGGPG